MFVVLLSYAQPAVSGEAHLEGHRKFIEKHFADGHFLLSGLQQPRNGGVIIARGSSRAELAAMFDQDPFIVNKVMEYTLIEFEVMRTAEALSGFKEV